MVLLKKIIICFSHRLLSIEGDDVVLEGTSTFSVGVIDEVITILLLLLEGFIVDASKIIIVELYVLQL
jgi:hypothetical protein